MDLRLNIFICSSADLEYITRISLLNMQIMGLVNMIFIKIADSSECSRYAEYGICRSWARNVDLRILSEDLDLYKVNKLVITDG